MLICKIFIDEGHKVIKSSEKGDVMLMLDYQLFVLAILSFCRWCTIKIRLRNFTLVSIVVASFFGKIHWVIVC